MSRFTLRFARTHAPLLALLALGCAGNGPQTPPELPAPGPAPIAGAATEAIGVQPVASAFGVYQLDVDLAAGTTALTPITNRESAAVGDLLAPDITPFLVDSPCADCFQVLGMSLEPTGELAVDFGLKHPFESTVLRRDLDGFDTRAIVIAPGTKLFPGSPKLHTDSDGTPDLTVSGAFDLVRNADGYTGHFDGKPADPLYFNPPLAIPGSVNPYRYFFTENDPDPLASGTEIANHRFSQSPVLDQQRFVFNLTPGGTQLRVIIVLETSYGVSALRRNPLTSLGGRQNPAYFLPAFNQPEAYRVEVELVGSYTEGQSPTTVLPVTVEVEDWQAGRVGNPAYGDTANLSAIPETSDVERVVLEVPGVMTGILTQTTPASGSGLSGDPYIYSFAMLNSASPVEGEYTGLVSVVDSLDGQGTRLTATPGQGIHSFVAYQPFAVTVGAGTGNQLPTAVGSANPNPVASGVLVGLIDVLSSDPDGAIVEYAWDFDISNGVLFTDEVNPTANQASTTYTNSGGSAIIKTASLRVTDNLGGIGTVNVPITVNPAPLCNATPPPNPTNFTVPTFPTPPYNGTSAANRITFSWIAPAGTDPCRLGYAVYRNDSSTGAGYVLVSDTNGNGTVEAVDAIAGTTWADTTLSGVGFKTSVKHYFYKVVTVKNNGAGGTVLSDLNTAPRVYVFFDDFENRNTFVGGATYSRTTSGFAGGLVSNLSFPGGSAFNNYGWDIAQNGAQGNANTGSRFLDESAYVANVPPSYGPFNHDPYEYAEDWAATAPDGYWNAIGPNIWIVGNTPTNPLQGTSFHRMQVFHKYQMQTTGGAADDVCYAAALEDSAWATGTNQFNDYVSLTVNSGKGFDSTVPGRPLYLDQAYRPSGNPTNAQQQIPLMHFFAGDFQTPANGLPNWGVSVLNLNAASGMTRPIIMFCHSGNANTQPIQTFGWAVDDICIIAY